MTVLRWLRWFAVVPSKSLILLNVAVHAVVHAAVSGGSEKLNEINVRRLCGGWVWLPPHTPYTLCGRFRAPRRRMEKRVAVAGGNRLLSRSTLETSKNFSWTE